MLHLHDDKAYGPQSEAFKPERFLEPGIKPPIAAFGSGQRRNPSKRATIVKCIERSYRICPERHFADNSAFIALASILEVFEISSARDINGYENQ